MAASLYDEVAAEPGSVLTDTPAKLVTLVGNSLVNGTWLSGNALPGMIAAAVGSWGLAWTPEAL